MSDHAHAVRSESREIPRMELRAAFRPETANKENRTVELIWTTGARVMRGFYDRFYEELSLDAKHVRMDRLKSGRAPLLDTHDGYSLASVMGVVQSARLNSKEGVCVVRFAKAEDDPEADKVFRKVIDGIISNVSVGYRTYKYEKTEGGDGAIPVYRAVDWEPYEISLVPMPADAGAGTRSATVDETNPCVFVTRTEEQTEMKPNPNDPTVTTPVTEARAADAGAATTPTAKPATTPPADENATRAAREEATKAERIRANGIRAAVRAAKLGDELADKLIEAGTSLDAARAEVLNALAAKDTEVRTESGNRLEVGDDAKDKWIRGASAWLFHKGAMTDAISRAAKAAPEKFKGVELDAGEFRGMSLIDLARESLERSGVKTRGMDKMTLVGTAMATRVGGMNGTSDFAILLENVMHKTLLAAYAVTPDSWTRFCTVGTVSDFRAHNRYKLGSFGRLDKLNEQGEFKNKQIPDGEKTSVTASTRGNIIAITRQAMINDDMGAFVSLATKLGRAAKLSIEMDVFDLLLLNGGLGPTQSDGQPLFHANRSNLGASAAISVDSIDADRVVMANQKDPSGNEILDLRPAILLLPIGLGGAARVLNNSQYDTSVSNKFQVPNKVVGLYRDIVDTPRLTGTRRYSLADPSIAPTFEVSFLDGQQEPFLDNEIGWRVDGTELKVRLDYGVAAVDYRGAVSNAGV